jgi:tryptophan synthase beta chain
MVREFQRVVGDEAREQSREILGGHDPDFVVACVGGGSNAMGTFAGFVDTDSELIGVEAGGLGIETGHHGASVSRGVPGALHGARSLYLQDEDGQILEAHSISAGLDYPGVGPQLSLLKDQGRLTLAQATDQEALDAFQFLARTEGIIPALESAHAVAAARKLAPQLGSKGVLVVNVSGRGDKDVEQVRRMLSVREPAPRRSKPARSRRPAPAKRRRTK